MSNNPPDSFRQFCTAELNDDGTITVSCALRDKLTGETFHFDHAIDTKPIAAFIANQFAAMSGDGSVAGLGSYLSKAKNAAVKVATSKAMKEVWKKATPIMKELAKEVPGGSVTLALATKTYETVSKARKGDKASIATIKNAALKAANGNPLAAEVMKTAKTLNTMLDVKEGKDGQDLAHRLALVERTLHPLLSNPQSPYKVAGEDFDDDIGSVLSKAKWAIPGYAAYRGVKAVANRGHKAPNRNHRAPTPRGVLPPSVLKPSRSVSAPQPQPQVESQLADIAYDMADEGYDGEEIAEEIAGWRQWAYSRPFRSPAMAAMQGDFGVSTSLRSLFSNGLDTIRAMAR